MTYTYESPSYRLHSATLSAHKNLSSAGYANFNEFVNKIIKKNYPIIGGWQKKDVEEIEQYLAIELLKS